MKRFLSLMLVLLMVFALCSCAGNADKETELPEDGTPVAADDAEPETDAPDADEPETEKDEPIDYPLDEETAALANEIISGLESDMELVRSILHLRKLEDSAVENGVDQVGNIVYLDVTLDDGTVIPDNPYIPFLEPYDTVESCMEIIHRVYTSEHSEQLYSAYFENSYYIQEIDGKLYGALSDYVDDWFDMPIQNAVRISDDEILAITTLTYHDADESDRYEITLKNENGEWKVDSMSVYSDIVGWRNEIC